MNANRNSRNKCLPVTGRRPVIRLLSIIVLLLISLSGCASADGKVLTQDLTQPLSGVKAARVEIDPGDGNLTIDPLVRSEQELASGTLQYLEKGTQPTHTLDTSSEMAVLTLKADGSQTWMRLPWEACNGATDWQIHLNPQVTAELSARTAGGNIKLNLTGMIVTYLLADTGGGNVEVILPDQTTNLNTTVKTGGGNIDIAVGSDLVGANSVSASSGAGNVVVRLPGNTAARIHASSGLGNTTIDARYSQIDDTTYQSPDYESAANKVEITVESGAGDVTIEVNS